MLNKEIDRLKKELNTRIENGEPFEQVYDLSLKLDKLIDKFYKKNMKEVK